MEKSRNLHNFNLPPKLTWGRQSLWRCVNLDQVHAAAVVQDSESSDSDKDNQKASAGKPRSIDDRQTQLAFEPNRSSSSARINVSSGLKVAEDNSQSLNSKSRRRLTSPLRTILLADGGINAEASGLRSEKKSTRPRRNLEKKEDKPKFSIQLSRKEIEEDFIAMTGKKPPRRPNKPPKSVQAKIDTLCPGLWLSEVHPDRYKVNEDGNT